MTLYTVPPRSAPVVCEVPVRLRFCHAPPVKVRIEALSSQRLPPIDTLNVASSANTMSSNCASDSPAAAEGADEVEVEAVGRASSRCSSAHAHMHAHARVTGRHTVLEYTVLEPPMDPTCR